MSTSWVWIAGIYIWTQYNYLTIRRGVSEGSEGILLAILAAALFFASILAHEVAHAVWRAGSTSRCAASRSCSGAARPRRARTAWTARRVPGGVRRTGDDAGARRCVLGGASRPRRRVGDRRVPFLALADLRRLERPAGVPARRRPDVARRRLGLHEEPPAGAARRRMVRVAIGVAFAAVAVWSLGNGDLSMAIFTGYIAMILVTTGRSMEQRIALRDRLSRGVWPMRCGRLPR